MTKHLVAWIFVVVSSSAVTSVAIAQIFALGNIAVMIDRKARSTFNEDVYN